VELSRRVTDLLKEANEKAESGERDEALAILARLAILDEDNAEAAALRAKLEAQGASDLDKVERAIIEGVAAMEADQLDDAENLVFFSQRRRHPRLDLEFTASLDALFETRLFRRCFEKLRISRLSNFAEQPFARGSARTLLYCRVHSRGVGQAELVSCREPQIAGAGSENIFYFAGDNGQQLFQLEGGCEGAA